MDETKKVTTLNENKKKIPEDIRQKHKHIVSNSFNKVESKKKNKKLARNIYYSQQLASRAVQASNECQGLIGYICSSVFRTIYVCPLLDQGAKCAN